MFPFSPLLSVGFIPSSSKTRSSTENIVIACAAINDILAKTERILICEDPKKLKERVRSTFPIQNPKIEPAPDLRIISVQSIFSSKN